jgi:hypothetical protein
MANYKVFGQIQDENRKGIPFADVYVSDIGGKPKTGTNKKFVTNEQGGYTLDVSDSDYVTARMVGYSPTTKAVKGNIVFIPNPVSGIQTPTMVLTLPRSLKTSLPEIEIVATKDEVKKVDAQKSETTPAKKDYKKWIWIGGGLLALIIVGVLIKKSLDKKTI